MNGLRLNLGCGAKKFAGYVNVDKFGEPDLRHDLEVFPWPWADDSVIEIFMSHVLEHLGHDPAVFLKIIQEMYRVSCHGAHVRIAVPHHRHEFYFSDPTHVRPITPLCMSLFSQKQNREWIDSGSANTPLGLYLGVDFEMLETKYKASKDWFRLHPGEPIDLDLFLAESNMHNNLVEEVEMLLRVVKEPKSPG